MNEFYQEYLKQLLKNIMLELKKGNTEKAKQYNLELKEVNKNMFLDKPLVK